MNSDSAVKPNLLPPGLHPGFQNLKSQPGVYRCRLRPETNKRDPRHADYRGTLQLTGSKASVLIWVHSDNTLGLRLEKIVSRSDSKPLARSERKG
jgi:hypothetical protein